MFCDAESVRAGKKSGGDHREGSPILRSLLECHGVDLPMASTILRFQNPSAFQIIDRHAYRAVYDANYPLYPASATDRKVETYESYLDELIQLCRDRSLDFEAIDRLLYQFDAEVNGRL